MSEGKIRPTYQIKDDIAYAAEYLRRNAERENWKRARYWAKRVGALTEELEMSRAYNRIVYRQRYPQP